MAIRFKTKVEPNLSIKIESNELYSVIFNLVINAHEAFQSLPQNKDAQIDVYAKKLNNEVIITLIDNGPGIEADTMNDVFQPFFTTKPVSGTGLGLSIVKRIIESRNGQIKMSNIECGCKVSLSFPLN